MRRVILTIVFAAWVPLVVACTPDQQAAFQAALSAVRATEDPADDVALEAGINSYLATRAEATAGRPCAEWYDLAIEVGWTPEQWKEPLSRIMYRESMCNPAADNPSSSALGLLQHLRFWADRCGIAYEQLTDPRESLKCGLITLSQQGWGAWATY